MCLATIKDHKLVFSASKSFSEFFDGEVCLLGLELGLHQDEVNLNRGQCDVGVVFLSFALDVEWLQKLLLPVHFLIRT